jgi:hypothetical protein
MGAVELRGQGAQFLERGGVVLARPGSAQPTLYLRPVALGEVVEHVALLVADAALHRRVHAEHVADRLAQRLGAVEHAQHALLCVEAAVDEVGKQRRRDGGVLGRALPQPERDLHAVTGDPEADDVRASLPPVPAVDFDRRERSQQERTRREDRRLKFYELRDNLGVLSRSLPRSRAAGHR